MTEFGYLCFNAVFTWVALGVVTYTIWVMFGNLYIGKWQINPWVAFLLVGVVQPRFLPFVAPWGFLGYFLTHSLAVLGLAAVIGRMLDGREQ